MDRAFGHAVRVFAITERFPLNRMDEDIAERGFIREEVEPRLGLCIGWRRVYEYLYDSLGRDVRVNPRKLFVIAWGPRIKPVWVMPEDMEFACTCGEHPAFTTDSKEGDDG
jgi:hypothetical protein